MKPEKNRKYYKKRKITPKQAFEEHIENDKDITVIAKEYKCDPKTVSRGLKEYMDVFLPDSGKLDFYKKNRADIATQKKMDIMEHMTLKKMKEAGIKELAFGLREVDKIERLDRGQSTENVHSLISIIDAMARKDLRKKKDDPVVKPDENIIEAEIVEEEK